MTEGEGNIIRRLLTEYAIQVVNWQNCQLDEVYQILYINTLHYSIRNNGVIRKFAAYIILEISAERKEYYQSMLQ